MDKFIFKCNKNEDLKNTPNIVLQNNEVLNKQIFGDADDPVNEIPVSRLEKKDRIDKGPYQPKFAFPRTIIGSKYRSFQIEWYNKGLNALRYFRRQVRTVLSERFLRPNQTAIFRRTAPHSTVSPFSAVGRRNMQRFDGSAVAPFVK